MMGFNRGSHSPLHYRGMRLVLVLVLCLGGLATMTTPRAIQAASPTLILGRAQNGPNNTEALSGSGFTPNSQVDIIISNTVLLAGQVLGTFPTDANGSFSGTVTLPLALDTGANFPNSLIARDHGAPALQATQPLIGVAVGAVLTTVTPGTITPGGTIDIIEGTGFGVGGPVERQQPDVVTLYLGDVPLTKISTGPSGNFAVFGVHVPTNVPVGSIQVTGRGIVTGIGQFDQASRAVTVVGATSVSASPNPAQPGSTLSVGGTGFAPNENVSLTATYADSSAPNGLVTQSRTVATDSGGAFASVSVPVPASAPRTSQVVVLARGQSSDHAAGTIVSLLGARSLFFDPTSAPPGSNVTVNGFGFVPGQQISVLGAGASGTANVDAQGVFTTSLAIPATVRPGTYVVTAQDQNDTNTRENFVVSAAPTATVTLQPSSGMPGARVVVTGTGFVAGEPIALMVENTPLSTQPSSVIADPNGAFSTTVVIPRVLSARSYVLTARGGQSLSAGQATLKVALPIASRWYFAEGFTGQGPTTFFSETLHLMNPGVAPAAGTILYMLPGGITLTVPLTVPAQSIVVHSVNHDVGNNKIVSALVAMDQPIAANRVMLRTNASGAPLDGNASGGETSPARLWHFAEGYTGVTFQQYLTVQNPSATSAAVTISLLPPTGTRPVTITTLLQPFSRYTLNVRAALPNRSLSTVVRASTPVVAERVLYWGAGSGSGKFGSDVKPGVTSPSTTSYVASASSANGDQTFYTFLNPAGLTSATPRPVTASAVTVDRAGLVVGSASVTIGPGQRGTLAATVPSSTTGPLATRLSASGPVIAEEAQYAGGSPNIGSHAGFALLGHAPATSWQFALGDTRGAALATEAMTSTSALTSTSGPNQFLGSSSFTETIYLYNPGSKFTNVTGSFYTPEGLPYYAIFDLPAHTLLAVDPSTIRGLPAGVHGSVFISPQGVGFIAAQVLRTLDGRVVLGDEGSAP